VVEEREVRIVLVGDSLVESHAPGSGVFGWGQVLPELLSRQAVCFNKAAGGRSSKSYRDEGLWAAALAERPDYVFIEFGHNDCPGKGPHRQTDPETTYAANLRQYVAETRAAGARPVLVTPPTRRNFGPDGRITSVLGPYAEAMKGVAAELGVPVIDLFTRSVDLFNQLGEAASAYINCRPDDRTHFSQAGARLFAAVVAEALPRIEPSLAPCLAADRRTV